MRTSREMLNIGDGDGERGMERSVMGEGGGTCSLHRTHDEVAVALLFGEVVELFAGTWVKGCDEGRTAVDGLGCALVDVERLGDGGTLLRTDLNCIPELLMNSEPIDQPLVSLGRGHVLDIFEIGILLYNFVLLMSSLDEVEGIGAKHPIEFLVDHGVDVLLEVVLEQLGEEVDHGLEEVLILEDAFGFAVAEEDAHVDVADLLAFLLQQIGLVDHELLHLQLVLHDDLLVLQLGLLDQQHVLVDLLEELLEQFRANEIPELLGDDEIWIFRLFLLHSDIIFVWIGCGVLM
jgi:hypothetical protein